MAKSTTKQSPAKARTTKGTTGARKPAKTTARSTTIRTYHQAIAFLNSHTNYERMLRPAYSATNFNMARMNRLLEGLGNPHKTLNVIHIAGTKGKGSTSHMTAAMLQQAGFKIGLFTSPHVIDLRERIVIDREMISEADFVKYMAQIAPVAKKMAKDGPTFFDIITAMAFLHFAENKVDFAVLETGLGGRLDSTNVCKPLVCGITSISFDHMAQLGNTLEKIAEEKAGIFKSNVPVICSPQTPGVTAVFREHAEKVGCPLKVIGEDVEFSYRFESSRASGPQNRVCMATPSTRFDHVEVPLLGEHQAYNCGIALGIIDTLREAKFDIPVQDAIDGLGKVELQGRCETIRHSPLTIIDTAHNGASIHALMRAIGQSFNYDSMVVIFACSADKDIDGMLKQLRVGADKVIFTNNTCPRSVDPNELMTRFQEITQKMAQVAPTLEEAFQIACNCVSRDDVVCVTGSTYIAGTAKQVLGEKLPE